ncbi:MAG TPA: histidine phosphatase family protein [Povalibacter sp.]|nr:histidine phosphatase family protein [Povalibacter sp.]
MIQIRRSRRTFLASIMVVAGLASAMPALAQLPAAPGPQFWFIRHGESEANVATHAHPQPDSGVSYPLTRTGMQQALSLAELLAPTRITAIYTSTRVRAIQTADAIAFRQGLNVKLAPEAAEIDLGIPLDAADARQQYLDLLHRWLVDKDIAAHLGDGESFADVQRRFLPFVRELMNRHQDDTGVIVIVSHSALLGAFVPVLAPNVPADFSLTHPLSNTSIIKTELRDGKLFCTEWAGVSAADFGD